MTLATPIAIWLRSSSILTSANMRLDVRFAAGHARNRLPPTAGGAWALFALTALGACLRFVRIGHQGFWFDEANTALLVHMSPGQMLGLIPHSESTPPLYYCVVWAWARLFGAGQAALRSLSALVGVATIPLMYGAAAKLFSRRTGLVVAAVTACDPLLIWYSQEARSYALLVALSAASLLAFAYALERPVPRTLALWAATGALALATHYYAVLAIVPEAVVLLIAHRADRGGGGRRAVVLAVGAVALCGTALIPLAIAQNATRNSAWIAPIPLGPRLAQVIPQFLTGFQAPAQTVIESLAAAMAVTGLALLVLRADAPTQRRAATLGGIAIGGLALNLALIAAGVDDLITRNVIALWVPAALVVAAGFAARRAGALGAGGRLGPVRDRGSGRGRRRHRFRASSGRTGTRWRRRWGRGRPPAARDG